MKKLFIIISLLIAAGSIAAQDFIYIGKSDEAERDEYEERSYVGLKKVVLKPGFTFSASPGKSFYAKIHTIVNSPVNPEMNFVRTETILTEVTDENIVSTLSRQSKSTVYDYSDGLGRNLQKVDVQSSPEHKDIIQPYGYDGFGRQPLDYLSYSIVNDKGGYRDGAIAPEPSDSELKKFYNGTSKVAIDSGPYNLKEFDDSPQNNVKRTYGQGADWQTASKFTQVLTKVDASESVLRWKYNSETEPPSVAGYAAGILTMIESTDEQGVVSREFKDFRGLTVLSVRDAANLSLKTYNVYDAAGNLRVVFPPEAVTHITDDYMAGSLSTAQKIDFLNLWTFQYVYDDYGRIIKKRSPGQKDWTRLVYDRWDRLVLTRESGAPSNEWQFTKYDLFNRAVLSGVYYASTSSANHDLLRDQAMAAGNQHHENTAQDATGYTLNNSFPSGINEADLRTVTYYDNYDFVTRPGWDNETFSYSFVDETGFPQASKKLDPVRGRTTGSKVRVLNTSRWLNAVTYYDGNYRVIQTISENYIGGTDRITSLSDFTGKVKSSLQVHTSNVNSQPVSVSIFKEFGYDDAGRLLTVYQTTGNSSRILLLSNKYNEAGQLVEKNIHSTNDGASFLQSIDYRYNIRGWLTSINNGTLTVDGSNDDSNDLFGMDILYNQQELISGTGTTKLFNGNISSIRWKTNNLREPAVEKIFGFGYDNVFRLTTTQYAEKLNGTWSGAQNMFTENMTYDGNGNIRSLHRKMKYNGIATEVDNLTYKYGTNAPAYDNRGNQLYNVTDGASSYWNIDDKNPGYGYAEKTHDPGLEEYAYDDSGRLTSDQNKEITAITYNFLNLPQSIDLSGGRKIEYVYDAAGNKLKTNVTKNGTPVYSEDYTGVFHYVGSKLAFVQTDEGRAVRNSANNTFEYEYFLKDHQDNTRVAFGVMKETDQYKATLESSLASNEENQQGFRIPSTGRVAQYNHTSKSAQLANPQLSVETNGFVNQASGTNKPVGIAKVLQVTAGDRVQLEAYARYTSSINGSTSVITTLASALTTTLGPATGESAQTALNSNLNGLIGGIPHNGSVAKAYLAYVLLDNSYVVRKFGYHRISSTAAIQHERLFIDETLPYTGYLYVYVANESNVSDATSVYFDDLSIIHEKVNTTLQVTQATDYYPFGLSFNGYSADRAGVDQNTSFVQNKFQFQGQERQNGFNRTGELDIDWYQFKFRMHDPTLGRFGVVDPLADKYTYNSPYAFSENRLIDGVELEGAEYIKTFQRYEYGDNSFANAFKVGGNVITDFMNILPNTWNSGVYTYETIRDHGWSFYGNGLKNEFGSMASGVGSYVSNQVAYARNNSASQQWQDTWQAFGKAESYESPLSFTLAALTTKNFASSLGRLGSGSAYGRAASGSIQYGTRGDAFLTQASRATQPAGVLDVAVHGTATQVEIGSMMVNHRFLANLISRNPQFTGQPIRLLSCNTGTLSNGFAKNLANKLGVPVYAPDNIIWAFPNGRLTIGANAYVNNGSFVKFLPGR